MNNGSTDEPSSTATYLLLSTVQMFGAGFVIWASLPAFKQLLLSPGQQLSLFALFALFCFTLELERLSAALGGDCRN
jgi:hypothetical protein